MDSHIGRRYQEETKYTRGGIPRRPMDLVGIPETYKRYPEALTMIDLPEAETSGGQGLWRILNKRRSKRTFTAASMPLSDLAQLLWATQGVTAHVGEFDLRTCPSAGALYPCETYVIANRVSELDQGLYHYSVPDHRLAQLRKEDLSVRIAEACLDQRMAETAQAVFVWTGVIDRSRWKYGERCFRYLYLDAGHIGGQLTLAAEALGLGSCMIGALYDQEVNAIVGVDGQTETTLYAGVVGKPGGAKRTLR